MAMRIRKINGVTIAICAARSIAKEGDIYLDDSAHHALSIKFQQDFSSMGFMEPSCSEAIEVSLMEAEESNNSNRDWWDSVYSKEHG